jgi:hypothetical protein
MKPSKKFSFFNDFLKENGVYSQGRVYLLSAISVYYIIIMILTITGVGKNHATIDMKNFEIILESIKYIITLFAGYVLGGKVLNIISLLKGVKPEESEKKQLLD